MSIKSSIRTTLVCLGWIAALIIAVSLTGAYLHVNSVESKDSTEIIGRTAPAAVKDRTAEAGVNELKDRVAEIENEISDIRSDMKRTGLLEPSTKELIPRVPFRIEVKFGKWQAPVVWTFRENGEVRVRYTSRINTASYKLYRNNNTIKIDSDAYDFYGLVLYDDYIAAVYENGWPSWVHRYKITRPRYNSLTQKYELD